MSEEASQPLPTPDVSVAATLNAIANPIRWIPSESANAHYLVVAKLPERTGESADAIYVHMAVVFRCAAPFRQNGLQSHRP
jgi:hypothetical protein